MPISPSTGYDQCLGTLKASSRSGSFLVCGGPGVLHFQRQRFRFLCMWFSQLGIGSGKTTLLCETYRALRDGLASSHMLCVALDSVGASRIRGKTISRAFGLDGEVIMHSLGMVWNIRWIADWTGIRCICECDCTLSFRLTLCKLQAFRD